MCPQNYRREIRKSHNKAAAQWELREKALKARLRQAGCGPLDNASHTIMREVWHHFQTVNLIQFMFFFFKIKVYIVFHFCLQVFSDKLLLHDVLARSDRALAVVHDLLGDPPLRQTGRIINMPRYPNFNVCVCVCVSDTQNDREPF